MAGPQNPTSSPALAAQQHPFDHLTPPAVLDALDAVGLRGDGRLLQLNSYENRVFQVMLEDGSAVVAKFYRPRRWSDEQILEEHGFALELAAAEVPVVAPLALPDGSTLAHGEMGGQAFRYAAFARHAGRAPELEDPETLRWLGRFIGRLHNVGSLRPFAHRRTLDAATFGHQARDRVLALEVIPPAQAARWTAACNAAISAVEEIQAQVTPTLLRLHGDCHPGNILWRDEGPHLVDLDDACMGPAVQDLWMLLSGSREAMASQLSAVLSGYRQFQAFNPSELALIEPLRTLRMIHHSAWLAERWSDPAFPAAFPWFGTPSYWDQQAGQLAEQLQAMAEPALALPERRWDA